MALSYVGIPVAQNGNAFQAPQVRPRLGISFTAVMEGVMGDILINDNYSNAKISYNEQFALAGAYPDLRVYNNGRSVETGVLSRPNERPVLYSDNPDVILRVGQSPHRAFHVNSQTLLASTPSRYFENLLTGPYVERKPDHGQWTVSLPDLNPDAMEFLLSVVHGDMNVFARPPTRELVELVLDAGHYLDMANTLGDIKFKWRLRTCMRPLDDLMAFEALAVLGAPLNCIRARFAELAELVNHASTTLAPRAQPPNGAVIGVGESLPADDGRLHMQDGRMLIDNPDHDPHGLFDLLKSTCVGLHRRKHAAIKAICNASRAQYATFIDIPANDRRNRNDACVAGTKGTARKLYRTLCHRTQLGGFYEELKRWGIADAAAFFDHNTYQAGTVDQCAAALLRFHPDGLGMVMPFHEGCDRAPLVHEEILAAQDSWHEAVAEAIAPQLPDSLLEDRRPWAEFWTDHAWTGEDVAVENPVNDGQDVEMGDAAGADNVDPTGSA
ncbi:hypothetical protein Micbo1qcDRAFT_206174 [Microdochium bolleyi]|uniref:BTB domain-containing protein n=1 Tax=Microdochium bolleyi TaxID=196109 RepID=A0A136IYF0_9PEZI|nr:hypothetical protein Micbo1qcDRAFT_206174 [Microdochium bolleyi]